MSENQGDSDKSWKVTRQVSVILQESNKLAVQQVVSGSWPFFHVLPLQQGPGTLCSLTLEEYHALSVGTGGMVVQGSYRVLPPHSLPPSFCQLVLHEMIGGG